jgi:hypothetical protein
MRALVALLLVTAWTTAAHADDVGVVVTGDPTMQPQLAAQLEGWLRQHGGNLVASPLPPDAVNSLIDCFVIEDSSCARGVVEKRAKTQTLVFARVDVSDNAASGMRDITLTAYWFDKGHDPVAERRTCEHCTDETLRTTTDGLMSALAGAQSDLGRLAVSASPAGAMVIVDGKPAGAAPIDVPLPAGEHRLTCQHPGHRDDVRTVTIKKGETTPVAVTLDVARSRSKLPYLVLGGGGALLLTGIVLYATSEEDTGTKFEYRDTKPVGIGVSVAGLAVAGVGTYLLLKRGPADAAPTVAVLPGGAYISWSRAF